MTQHNIPTDNSAYSDDEADSPQDSANTHKQSKKRTKGQDPDVNAKRVKNTAKRQGSGKRSTGIRQSKRLKPAGVDNGSSKDAQTD